ncbi:MAG: DUF1540 domain-containing protein [Bacillota bacterium]|nr:DUF1540 domain-containing protein [Bacillota bacterium]
MDKSNSGKKTSGAGKSRKPNSGVSCDVNSCIYNDKDFHCTASKITVGPEDAETVRDTVCATFEQKNTD